MTDKPTFKTKLEKLTPEQFAKVQNDIAAVSAKREAKTAEPVPENKDAREEQRKIARMTDFELKRYIADCEAQNR